MKKNLSTMIAVTAFLSASVFLTGCGAASSSEASANAFLGRSANKESVGIVNDEQTEAGNKEKSSINGSANVSGDDSSGSNTATVEDISDLFSKRDLNQDPDLSEAKKIVLQNEQTFTITEEGIYVISGKASNCTIRVEADKEAKVQLVFDGVSVENDDFPAVYVVSADKCFITTTDSENSISVTGQFISDGDTKTDAVIFSKDDLVLNGKGNLDIISKYGNGISGKDDIKVTGGTYNIQCAKDAIEANDSIAVSDGSFIINTSKDALHAENDDDDTTGWICITGGTFDISASGDAIQATTYVRIDGGEFDITASEGIEATYVQINDGNISINASDDGINASAKSSAYSIPAVEFNGGSTTIVMGQGDTDAVDANGNIFVNGGTIDITATVSSFDYDGKAEFNGGTIIINGSEVDSIPQSMMGGFGGRGGFGDKGGFGGNGEFGGNNGNSVFGGNGEFGGNQGDGSVGGNPGNGGFGGNGEFGGNQGDGSVGGNPGNGGFGGNGDYGRGRRNR